MLKASLPSALRIAEIKPIVDKLHDKRKLIKEDLDIVKEDIEGKEQELETLRKEIHESIEHRDEIKADVQKYEDQVQVVKEEINGLFEKKNALKEEYYKGKLEYELENEDIKHKEWVIREKTWLIEEETKKAQRLEERKQAIANRPNPFDREIETCQHLINFCNKQKVIAGLVEAPVEEMIKSEQKQIMSQLSKEEVQRKLQDGKIERVKSKAERDQEAMLQIGRKKKGGEKKKKTVMVQEAFNIDINTINKFGFLKVSPPLGAESLEDKLKELGTKL